ncbi:MAG TPA: LacI family DNA-binding transcriptional regulator [Phototrophicaceae bacterium]|nr:LacI family DNA-binding transcriptional regulator [Phototrophicaceae bacterium]
MNLEDIAKKAGVSRSTVSRVINSENHVSAQTRRRVLEVIEQEGYTPNPAARMLVTRRSQVIGVVIPSVGGFVFDDNFYFPTLLRGASDATNERDYGMLVWMGDERSDAGRFYRRVLQNRLMDGLVLSSFESGSPLIEQMIQSGTTFVTTERPDRFHDQISYVTVDNVHAAVTAVEHLIQLGRCRIATITGSLSNIDVVDRLEGYRIALERAGLPYDEHLVMSGRFVLDGGYEAMERLLVYKPDAVFIHTDQMALGALQALRIAGVRCPDDIAIVGFDDLPSGRTSHPSLTTIRQPVLQKGFVAGGLLIDLIEGNVSMPQHIILPTELVVRESCGGNREKEDKTAYYNAAS